MNKSRIKELEKNKSNKRAWEDERVEGKKIQLFRNCGRKRRLSVKQDILP